MVLEQNTKRNDTLVTSIPCRCLMRRHCLNVTGVSLLARHLGVVVEIGEGGEAGGCGRKAFLERTTLRSWGVGAIEVLCAMVRYSGQAGRSGW